MDPGHGAWLGLAGGHCPDVSRGGGVSDFRGGARHDGKGRSRALPPRPHGRTPSGAASEIPISLGEALGAKRLIGWGTAVAVVIVAVLVLQRSEWGGLETVGAAASTALAWGGTALTWLGVWLFRIAVGAVLVLLALGIVSQVGTTFWLPFKGAWSAGRASNSNADFAAGAGVALSVILAAASFNPGFNAWLSAQLQSLPLNPTFAVDFHGWFPAASIQPWTDLFESFSGFPEFGLIVVTLLVGIVSLAFGGQGDYRETGPMAVATAAIARVTTTLLLTLIILYVMSKLRDE